MALRIAGIIQCKDDWGLIAVSISHALLNHVDVVYALNDSSTDRTSQGLRILQELFPNRIHIFDFRSEGFLQEAATNVMIHLCRYESPDWIYVFDADEFLMLPPGQTLRDILAKLGPDKIGVMYRLRNHVSTFSFDESCLDDYRKLRYEAIAFEELGQDWKRFSRQIDEETLNFLNTPFLPKVIVRNSRNIRLIAGAHGLKVYSQAEGSVVPAEEVSVAHLSWLSRDRLTRKAEHGRRNIISGAPPDHGWQNQMLFKMYEEDKLDELWRRHSIPDNSSILYKNNLAYVINEEFLLAVTKTLDFLYNEFGSNSLNIFRGIPILEGSAEETNIPFRSVVELTKRMFENCDFETSQKTIIASELAAAIAERDNARVDVKQTHQHLAEITTRLRDQNTVLTGVRIERDALLNSTIWRASQPIRKLVRLIPTSWRRIFHH